jgi:hypothetical protein
MGSGAGDTSSPRKSRYGYRVLGIPCRMATASGEAAAFPWMRERPPSLSGLSVLVRGGAEQVSRADSSVTGGKGSALPPRCRALSAAER